MMSRCGMTAVRVRFSTADGGTSLYMTRNVFKRRNGVAGDKPHRDRAAKEQRSTFDQGPRPCSRTDRTWQWHLWVPAVNANVEDNVKPRQLAEECIVTSAIDTWPQLRIPTFVFFERITFFVLEETPSKREVLLKHVLTKALHDHKHRVRTSHCWCIRTTDAVRVVRMEPL